MNESIANRTSSFPTVCNYIPQEPAMDEQMVIYEQTSLLNPTATEDTQSKKRAGKTVLDKTPQEVRAEVLASMHATLLKTISNVCVNMINTHRERLKKQYKMAEEEMQAIQGKNA